METMLLVVVALLLVALLALVFALWTKVVGGVQVDLRGVAERVSTVEQKQNAVGQDLQSLQTGLARSSTVTETLAETAASIRTELSRAREGLTELQTHAKVRQDAEQRTAESIRRLEAIIAGSQAKGSAGENILEIVFAKLPLEWQVRNFKVGGKVVEFGLRLPDGLILPIDSKWPATDLLERFFATEDPAEQQRLKGQIENAVLARAREVRKYLAPDLTVGFAIAAVPDAVYDLSYEVQAQVFQDSVVLVSYGNFVPYLLLVFQTVLKTSRNVDLEKLNAYLATALDSIDALQRELEGPFSKAVTMLNNCHDKMTVHLGKVNSGLMSLRISAGPPAAVALPEPHGEE